MTSAMTAFGIAVGATSAICYALMRRAERLRGRRGSSRGGGGSDTGFYDGWNLTNWFGSGEGGAAGGSFDGGAGASCDSGGGDSGSCDGGGGDVGGGN